MTHPFHPWSGQRFEFVSIRHTWKQHRVFFLLDDGTQTSLPIAWTDLAEPDAFVNAAAGRSTVRPQDLLALAELIDGLRPPARRRKRVRQTSPHV
ncbi:MAG: DUF5372 family protein [Acidimicrobiales bacterium]